MIVGLHLRQFWEDSNTVYLLEVTLVSMFELFEESISINCRLITIRKDRL